MGKIVILLGALLWFNISWAKATIEKNTYSVNFLAGSLSSPWTNPNSDHDKISTSFELGTCDTPTQYVYSDWGQSSDEDENEPKLMYSYDPCGGAYGVSGEFSADITGDDVAGIVSKYLPVFEIDYTFTTPIPYYRYTINGGGQLATLSDPELQLFPNAVNIFTDPDKGIAKCSSPQLGILAVDPSYPYAHSKSEYPSEQRLNYHVHVVCDKPIVSAHIQATYISSISYTTYTKSKKAGAPICPQQSPGSIIRIDDQSLGEAIPLVGTEFSLNYRTSRTKDFVPNYQFTTNIIPSDSTYSGTIPVSVAVAGQVSTQTLTVSPGSNFSYTWDGLNGSSSRVLSPVLATVSMGNAATNDPLARDVPEAVGSYMPQLFGMPGWTVSVHHYYNKDLGRLYLGDGSTQDLPYQEQSGGSLWVISPNGDELYVFDMNGKHIETKTSLTGVTKYSFGYDSGDRLISITDAFGNQTTFNRSAGALISIQGPYGQTTTIGLNANGMLASVTNPNSEVYSMTYKTGTDLLETFAKPGAQTNTMSYNSDGELTEDLGNGGDFWTFVKTIDPVTLDKTVVRTSNMGRETTYTASYADGVYTNSSTNPYGFTSTTTQAEDNSIQNSGIEVIKNDVAPDGRLGGIGYRVVHHKRTIGTTEDIVAYDQTVTYPTGITPGFFNYSSITTTSSHTLNVTTEIFDAATKTFTRTSPEGTTEVRSLNSHEQTASMQVGGDTATSFTYDTHGRLSQQAQGTHNIFNYTYNTAGYVASVTDALSHTTGYTYDLAGRVTSMTLPDSRVVAYGYDSNGNMTSVTPPGKPLHGFTFNAMELLDTYSPPSLSGLGVKNTTYTYNNDKQLTQITRPDGASVGYTHNATTGLLSSLNLSRGDFNYSYVANSSQLDHITSPDDVQDNFGYYGSELKANAQKKTSTGVLYGKVTFGFDNHHRKVSRTIQGKSGATIYTENISYNADEVPSAIGDETLTYEYPSGRLSTTAVGKISDSRTYDNYGNLVTYTAVYTPTSGPAQTLYSYTLTRDLMGKITETSETVMGTTDVYDYSYDSAGRLTQVLKNSNPYSSYTYDDNGNRISGTTAGTSFTATYDDQDRLLTYNSRTYSYNANGDVTGIQWNTTDTSSFTYDALGSLLQATLPSGAVLDYSYDGLNRMVNKNENGAFKFHYIYENDQRIAAQINASGAIIKEYVYGTAENVPDYMVSGGVDYFFIKDHLGSPRLIVNTNNGTVTQRMDYNDLGEVVSDTNSGFQHFGFAGGRYDGGTKLVHFGARDYDPRSGRWMTKDPIRFGGGDTNLFGYVLQDPVNWVDPEGTRTEISAAQTGMSGGGGSALSAALQAAAMAEAMQCAQKMDTKNLCPEGYEKAKENCYATTKPKSDARNACFASAYLRCVKGVGN